MFCRPTILFLCTILVIATALICFSGCGVENKEDKGLSEDMWQGVITLWDFPRWPDENGNRFGWIERKISEFEKSHREFSYSFAL